ncbi:MAG: hypothetical protein IIC66_09330 [candidate division Zixibacteria bacterium]|nr:hypothetical protein [candidate division Zixibacteria bacterium]
MAKGELQIENQLDLRYNNRINNRYFFTDSLGNGFSSFGDNVSYLWNFQSLIKWGITDQINLYANIASDYGLNYTTRFNENYRGGSIINQSYGSGSSFIYVPSINISVTSSLGSDRFLKLEYGQWFNKSGSEGVSYSSSVPLDSVITRFSKTETRFRSLKSHAAVNLRLVKSGKFNSSILLDDYQDYYKGMLFDDQLVIDVGFKVSHFGGYSTLSYENYDLFILSKIGLSDNLNLGARISYSLSHWGYFDKIETVKSYIVGKFRNYKYDSQNGPGWKRDHRYDQVLGSILRPGNLYVEVQYVPPMFGGQIESDINFFSFKKFGSTGVHSVLVKFQIGLGRNFSATIDDRETYAKKYTVSRRYSLGISKRILDHTNLSLSYIQSYYRSRFGDPFVNISIKALI